MKDAQKPDHIGLNGLITRLKEGRFVIPDFQREFEWRPTDIRDLMRSIFLDYFIGSLLLWKGKPENFEALSCEPIYGLEGPPYREHIVLDGQQRLTAIYYAFCSPNKSLPNRTNRYHFFIRVDKFMAQDYDEAFDYVWSAHQWVSHREAQFGEHIFPLSVVGQGGWALPDWIHGYEQHWDERAVEARGHGDERAVQEAAQHIEDARAFGLHLKGITEQYQVSYIELAEELSIDKVCDIFTQVNSRGVRLDVFDLMNALLKPKGVQLKHMWRAAAEKLEVVETEKMNVYVLQVMSILRQTYCSPKYLYYLLPGQAKAVRAADGTQRTEVLVEDGNAFRRQWSHAVGALEYAIRLLWNPMEFGVTSSQYLPYVAMLPLFAALEAEVRSVPAARQLDAQRKIRHWYWASVFTNRYSGSVESTIARDLLDMKAWFDSDDAEPPVLQEFADRIGSLDLRGETKKGTAVYGGVFNLLVLQGAKDWFTGNVPQLGELDDHHIVPGSWGVKSLKGDLINSVLNRTPLSAETNRRVIGDRLPNAYLPELIAENGERNVRAILDSHFISSTAQEVLLRDPFRPDDFEEFIGERHHTLLEAIENLLAKERIDLTPQLRDLDERAERVELGMREFIVATVGGNAEVIPSHVLQRVGQRADLARRKNPGGDPARYQSLAGKLEFCDLRELEDIIVAKALWPSFETRFGSKGTLNAKFNQLAELRNGIRHSRAVDEVTRKEGEAAIIWFEGVLPLRAGQRPASGSPRAGDRNASKDPLAVRRSDDGTVTPTTDKETGRPRGRGEEDEVLRARAGTDFMRRAVIAIEDWVDQIAVDGLAVEHGTLTRHRLKYLEEHWLGYSYAKTWLLMRLYGPSDDEIAALRAGLTKPREVRPTTERGKEARWRFHVATDADLDIVKQIIVGRLRAKNVEVSG